jgi:hypothetical protein
MSISDLRTGSLRIQIEAGTSSEFPNPRLLNSAVLESATVTLNGIEINLKTKDFERQPVGNSFIHVYDLKPKDLSAID